MVNPHWQWRQTAFQSRSSTFKSTRWALSKLPTYTMFNTGCQQSQDQLDGCWMNELSKNMSWAAVPSASPRHKELYDEGRGLNRFVKCLTKCFQRFYSVLSVLSYRHPNFVAYEKADAISKIYKISRSSTINVFHQYPMEFQVGASSTCSLA